MGSLRVARKTSQVVTRQRDGSFPAELLRTISHPEAGSSCLVSDELTRRADRLLERRRKQAGFRDAHKTLDNFDFTFNPKMNDVVALKPANGGTQEQILFNATSLRRQENSAAKTNIILNRPLDGFPTGEAQCLRGEVDIPLLAGLASDELNLSWEAYNIYRLARPNATGKHENVFYLVKAKLQTLAKLRIPRDVDQRSELMSITIPK
jgi:hypothetical protein